MAVRKLSLLLFPAKPRVSLDTSTFYLHFIAAINRAKNHYSIVCETNPLITYRSFGLPTRCPLCGALNPLKEIANGSHEE